MTHEPATAVLHWGLPRLRDLPWRHTRDPWAVLVSEVMLQQTQVARVVPKWSAFLLAFPTPAACAAASLGDVLRLWQGLGYPRRARNLHATAGIVSAAGLFPSDLTGMLALPGVGAYTARAVLAFAFEADVAVVDTNTARVLARVGGVRLTQREVQAAADHWLPPGEAWAWNQCLMDLGATLCRPAGPACTECPLSSWCAWRGVGDDPAAGSAGVSRAQAPFAGSERQARGRLLAALAHEQVSVGAAAQVMSHRAAPRLVDDLCAEGLVRRDGDWLLLP
ncbi:MAG: A/G-specific adenine glycosylase [Actinomycetota bacterium]|nr:A/G-specific adenine glycosylase [Actinomycetota bacterium]